MAATAKSVKNVPKFVSLETKLHLERRGEPVIGLDQIEVIKPLFDNSLIVSGVSLSEVKIGDNPADILLNNIANASCKKEDDAKLSYEVAHRLILKLAEYVTEKAANPVKVSRNIMINQNSCSYLLLCFVKVFFVKSIPQKKNFGGIDFMEKIQILLTCISLIPRRWKNGTKF